MMIVASFHKHPIKYTIGAWILSVLIYMGFYSYLWNLRPDSFILNKEFNLTPIQNLQEKLWLADKPPPFSPMDEVGDLPKSNADRISAVVELDSMAGIAAELDKTASDAVSALVPLSQEQRAIEAERKRAFDNHSESTSKNVDAYTYRQLAGERMEVRRRASLVESLERQFGNNPPNHQAIVLAEARVALAHARYQEVLKDADVAEYVLKNFSQFADSSAVAEVERLQAQLQGNEERQRALRESILNVRRQALENMKNWYHARQGRLSCLDFLYFSVGVSTTTTFGDIIPNSRAARMIALSQLILSIFIVGFLVSRVGNPVSQDKK